MSGAVLVTVDIEISRGGGGDRKGSSLSLYGHCK